MAGDKQIDALLSYPTAAILEARQDKRKAGTRDTPRIGVGGGKKKVAKVCIGLAIGDVALAITIGAGGAALIAGLAAAEDQQPQN